MNKRAFKATCFELGFCVIFLVIVGGAWLGTSYIIESLFGEFWHFVYMVTSLIGFIILAARITYLKYRDKEE